MEDRWDTRDRRDMDELRNDLMGCPRSAVSAVIAEFSEDPVAKVGARILRNTSLVAKEVTDAMWREFLYNIIPTDGRHPHVPAVERLMRAAELHGWADPRAMAPAPAM